MAKTKISEYDATAGNNTDIDSISLAENVMIPSDVNNALRELMAHLKDFSNGTSGIDVLNLADDDASASIKLQAPATVASTVTFTMPATDGSNGTYLGTDGSGNLSFSAVQSGAGYFQGENGATGDTTNGKGDIFRVHEQQLDTNTTIASGDNAGAFCSLTVATGATLTVNGNLVIA